MFLSNTVHAADSKTLHDNNSKTRENRGRNYSGCASAYFSNAKSNWQPFSLPGIDDNLDARALGVPEVHSNLISEGVPAQPWHQHSRSVFGCQRHCDNQVEQPRLWWQMETDSSAPSWVGDETFRCRKRRLMAPRMHLARCEDSLCIVLF